MSDPEGDRFFLVLRRLPDVVTFELEAFDLLPVSNQLFANFVMFNLPPDLAATANVFSSSSSGDESPKSSGSSLCLGSSSDGDSEVAPHDEPSSTVGDASSPFLSRGSASDGAGAV